ncbi:MAG: hypothetical protein P9L88_08795 [Candidatus Tantalella remota]|nr:hypothetical protein [Candidatus Tantalella remota]
MENVLSFALGMARQFSPVASAALFVGSLAVMGLCFATVYFFLRAIVRKNGERARRTRLALEELDQARKTEIRLDREAQIRAIQDEEIKEFKDWMGQFDRTEADFEVHLRENKVSLDENDPVSAAEDIPAPSAEDVSVKADKETWMETSQIYRALFRKGENTPPGEGKTGNV